MLSFNNYVNSGFFNVPSVNGLQLPLFLYFPMFVSLLPILLHFLVHSRLFPIYKHPLGSLFLIINIALLCTLHTSLFPTSSSPIPYFSKSLWTSLTQGLSLLFESEDPVCYSFWFHCFDMPVTILSLQLKSWILL